MPARYKHFLPYLIPLIVAIGVLVIATHQARQIALSDQDNVDAFYSFSAGLEEYRNVRQEWRTRILSNLLAGMTVNLVERAYGLTDREEVMQYVPSLWTFAWLLLTFLLFIILVGERALLYILGIFAGVSFAYTPGIGFTRIYPWDLPALFLFACFVGLLILRRVHWLVVLIPVATLFKETALVLLIAFLFWDSVSMRRRLAMMAITLLIAASLKGAVDIVTASPSPIFTMTAQDPDEPRRYIENIEQILNVREWTTHPVFINAGLTLALLVLPITDQRILMLKVISIAFILGNFMFALIVEFRIWFELIPLSLYAIDLHFFGASRDRAGPLSALSPALDEKFDTSMQECLGTEHGDGHSTGESR